MFYRSICIAADQQVGPMPCASERTCVCLRVCIVARVTIGYEIVFDPTVVVVDYVGVMQAGQEFNFTYDLGMRSQTNDSFGFLETY